MLNFSVLLGPTIAPIFSLGITAASLALCAVISRSFFRSYSFAGFGYLLGLPVGFAFLGASSVIELAGVLFLASPVLYPALFWIQMVLQAEAYALIALSYYYKTTSEQQGQRLAKNVGIALIPALMIAIPFLVPTAVLASQPYFNYPSFADLSFYLRIFNVIVVGYIFKSTIASLVRAANIKLLYVPAAFALLWLEQYSLIIAFFDNSMVAFIGSAAARIAGLMLFAYVMHSVTSRRKLEIEARKAA